MKESNLRKKIASDLPPGSWHFVPMNMGFGKTGIPDLVCIVPMVIKKEDIGKVFGLGVCIEVKLSYNKPTENQWRCLREIAAAGGSAIVATQTTGKEYKLERVYALTDGDESGKGRDVG